MSQEYHNRITVEGNREDRRKLLAEVFGNPPENWDWVGITINEAASRGKDSGKSLLDFWSRNFPERLGELSIKFPEIRLECDLADITGETRHCITLVDGLEVASRSEPIVWIEDDVDEAAEERAAEEREAKVILELESAAADVVGYVDDGESKQEGNDGV